MTRKKQVKRNNSYKFKNPKYSSKKKNFGFKFGFLSNFGNFFNTILSGDWLLKSIFTSIFVIITFNLAILQIPILSAFLGNSLGLQDFTKINQTETLFNQKNIILSKRGQILIQDKSQGADNIAVTVTKIQNLLFFDPKNLHNKILQGISVREAAFEISATLNLPFNETLKKFEDSLNLVENQIKEGKSPISYAVLADDIGEDQISRVRYLRRNDIENNRKLSFSDWLGVAQKQSRQYPENTLLASTIGYTPNYLVGKDEIKERFGQCVRMVENNELRGTDNSEYMVGVYGIEQKYCSTLGGLNGVEADVKLTAVDGSNIYLTIDRNLQKKSEEILFEAIKSTTGAQGIPKDGSVIIMEAKTGRIRAMASWPSFDPNNYQEYANPNSQLYNPMVFRNVSTSVDYDIGSVMKPLTVAAALNVYEQNVIENGIKKGVAKNFGFTDYAKGKPYENRSGGKPEYITNASNVSFPGTLGLKECIRDSVNTCIADVVDATGARQLNRYFKEVYKFGQATSMNLPGDENGNVVNFDNDITCPFCYANFGFGQGFTSSPIQLVRAYTALANKGVMIEPYLVEKIENSKGEIDDGKAPNSEIRRDAPRQVISSSAAESATQYMVAVTEEGYLGQKRYAFPLTNYIVASKTGTSEVNRPFIETDSTGRPKINEKGEIIQTPCDYLCNRQKGVYDHTLIGFGPASDPQYIVFVKISEPNRGVVNNFSTNTVAQPFKNLMEYTLNYYGVPKDR
jgi:cell division protein FtsI/penicillin-binding protein 2